MLDTKGKFFLGKFISPESPVMYDPDDLTTHAVVVGMTGSGKTGLCLGLLEEAALGNIPAIMIDPKGDITNALLHFPDLLPADFQPWVNAEEARREGITIEQAGADAAKLWRDGLASWGMGPDRLRALKNSADFTIFTPGSDAGVPISILASLKAPSLGWTSNAEAIREQITGTVTALLGLVGMEDVDPLRSREHILLSNIFESAWSTGKDLDMGELIMQVQSPPFTKLGVFDINQFFPEDDRFSLAMLLNNILASPGFQVWTTGVPLDIQSLMYREDGKPRHSVFYIAHLTDSERMFFVTLLYSAVETWMRTQGGTNSLRALVYFDEIFGYLPPTSNPPSKPPMLRMLKQARAFGVGMLLVTQNPADLDYKALTNTGTWFIGRLQADRDKQRLLDGLEGAASGGLERKTFDSILSGLGKRQFLLHNVHEKEPKIFGTRWAMNYMAGPLTRAQIPMLNALTGGDFVGGGNAVQQPAVQVQAPAPAYTPTYSAPVPAGPQNTPTPVTVEEESTTGGTTTKPALSAKLNEYFLPHNLTISESARLSRRDLPADATNIGILYRPVLLAQANVRFLNRTYDLNLEKSWSCVVVEPDTRGFMHWEDHLTNSIDPRGLDRRPLPDATFGTLEPPFTDATAIKAFERDFADWIYREGAVTVRTHKALKINAGPDVSEAEFRKMLAKEAAENRDADIAKKTRAIETRMKSLETKLSREERDLEEAKDEVSQRKMEEYGTHAENLLSLFGKRRRSLTTSLSKRRMTERAKAEVEESLADIERFEQEIKELIQEREEIIQDTNEYWSDIIEEIDEVPVSPYKKDILIDLFGVAWLPYIVLDSGAGKIELPGFDPGWKSN